MKLRSISSIALTSLSKLNEIEKFTENHDKENSSTLRDSVLDLPSLRLVSDLLQYSRLTLTIRKKLGTACLSNWSIQARRDLQRFGNMLAEPVSAAIRENTLHFPGCAATRKVGAHDLFAAFNVRRRFHLFRVQPLVPWLELLEPQLTKGIAHFLGNEPGQCTTERVRAFLKALGASEDFLTDFREPCVKSEAGIRDRKRLDLLIKWGDCSQRRVVAVDAKIGHEVSEGQLQAYGTHLGDFKTDSRLLVLVGVRPTRNIEQALRDNPDWTWTTWHDLLIMHERCLSDDFDDLEYARFRRSLWDRTG